ncbi:hypothetical protein C8Q76DRAFT_149543 [Earliella scabrosa]|nr:hypothetical protein C8Q76DRAFT_149543 [Earliella scabrosa]
MAKPRNSVLYMFDPLHQSPSTPRRDSSDDCGPSDKENDIPPGDLTVFFNRTFAAHKQEVQSALVPQGKLIDVGDTPAPGRFWDAGEHDGSDADGEQSESDAEGCGVLSPPRIPLAELDLEHTPRPQESGRPLKAPVFAIAASRPSPLPALLEPAPQSSPLAEIVNSINFSALSVAEETVPTTAGPPTHGMSESVPSRSSSPFPEINVCAPETPITADFEIPEEEEVHTATTAETSSHLRPPASLTQLSPDDPRRTSVDLYSSFHLQMQSADMSFDLLNDKVSFLGHGQDSFWGGGDDTLDFSDICVPSAMKAKLDQLVPIASPVEVVPKRYEPVFSPPTKTIATPLVMSPTTETAMKVPLPTSPTFSAPPSRNITPPRLTQPAFSEPPSPPTSPVVADEPSLLLEPEPLPPPFPAAVPALRIVKKTFKMAGHQSTAPSSSGAKTEVEKQARRSSLAPAKPPAPQPIRPAIRGVQRPPPGLQNAGGVVIGLPPQGASINTAASTASTTSTSSSGGSASQRATAPASRFAGIQRPNLAAKERAAPRTMTSGPRSAGSTAATRAAPGITRAASCGVPKSISSVVGASALRPPSRGGVATSGATALPKPVSRLPGPSGLTRTASMSSRSGVATSSAPVGSTTAASRVRASTMSRATRF